MSVEVYTERVAISERTYSFRATADFADRVQRALADWEAVLGDGTSPEAVDHAHRAFAAACFRRLRELDPTASQSALFRELVETFVQAAQKAVEDVRFVDEYRAWAEEDEEGPRFRDAAAEAAAERWLSE